MADRDIFVVEPATSQDLITLNECKLLLNLSLSDTSRDAQLKLQISTASAVIADMANRKPELGFGETRVIEEWRELMNGRVQVMHWPISQDDPIMISANGAPYLEGTDFRIDFNSGKISVGGSWSEPVSVEYTGGYKLPEAAPLPLKKACALIVQEDRIKNQQAQVAGMRQISHKESRVAFFDPNLVLLKTIGAKSAGVQAAENLIRPYIRIEV